jgi:hypothetical protein
MTIEAYIDSLASIIRVIKEFSIYSKIRLRSLILVSSTLFAVSIYEIPWHKSCYRTYSNSYTSRY